MSQRYKVVLISKPWRGGLSRYLAAALEAKYPGQVQYVDTYPVTRKDRFEYHIDRARWRLRLMEGIAKMRADMFVFINLLPEFAALTPRDNYCIWLTDNPAPVLNQLQPYARIYISDPGYADLLSEAVGSGRFCGVLPFACEPKVHHRQQTTKQSDAICFIANRDVKRDRILNYVFEQGERIKVYGNYFLRHRLAWRYPAWFYPAIHYRDMGRVYARHSGAVNIHAAVVRGGTNMRTFECAAYRIPQLVEYRPGLEALFDLEAELLVFEDERDVLEKIQRMRADPIQAQKRAAKAYQRVLAEHTYSRRVERLLQDV